jgi:hypothetical protein
VQVVWHVLPLHPRLMPHSVGLPATQSPVASQVLGVSIPLLHAEPHAVPAGG